MIVKPGTYRELFTRALLVLIKQPQTSDEEKTLCQYYLDFLANEEYVFGKTEVITILKRNTKDQ